LLWEARLRGGGRAKVLPEVQMINSFKDLKEVILSYRGDASSIDWHEYGQVNVQQLNDLILFSYKRECQYKSPEEWNWFEKVSRGLVMNTSGEIVARPFDKFWNYGEVQPTGEVIEITEKVDGSLAVIFHHNGQWHVCTRGSFVSEQAIWAEKFLHENYDLRGVQTNNTLLCEIIYPDNQIVIDYGDREDLVLLGIRNNNGSRDWWFSAVKLFANCYGFKTPPCYEVEDIDKLIKKAESLGPDHEGWVVRYSDGTRVKVKGAAYLELHKWIGKFIANEGFKTVAKALADDTLDELVLGCPKALEKELYDSMSQIDLLILATWSEIEELFRDAPKETRKDFALWVKQQKKEYQKYLFLYYDKKLTDRDIAKGIYQEYD
jgi:RNA ligase